MNRPSARVAGLIIPLGMSLLSSSASAGGFLVARFGGEHGHATTTDPTALYYNPAGLALTHGTRLYVDGTFALRRASYDRPAGAIDDPTAAGARASGTPPDGVAANAGRATLSDVIASPFVGLASDLGTRHLAVGLSFATPFGGPSIWDRREGDRGSPYPGAVDGPQRWSSIDGTIRSSYVSAGGAVRIPALRLSLGLSANLVLSKISSVRARNGNGTDDLISSSGAVQEGRSYLDADGVTMSAAAGAVWEPMEGLWLGVSYQSQPGFGEMVLTGTLEQKLATAGLTRDAVDVRQSLPDVVRWSARYRPAPRLELRIGGDVARWSSFVRQCVLLRSDPRRNCAIAPSGALDEAHGGSGVVLHLPRNWKDTLGLRGGASYWIGQSVEAFTGAGYDSNAVPDATIDPALFDMDKLSVSGGVRVSLAADALFVDATFTQVIYLQRTVAPRPRDAAGKPETLASPSRQPDMAGTYSQSASVLVVGLGYVF